jgi:natural product precursor
MKKRAIKKLTLSKESILRLDSSDLREVVGGATLRCTATEQCTESCGACTGNTCLC